jgi:hypothetical protein
VVCNRWKHVGIVLVLATDDSLLISPSKNGIR